MSFGVHSNEERAARMYDRAMIVEKGRAAKTNFPLAHYEAEVAQYQAICRRTCVHLCGHHCVIPLCCMQGKPSS